jgi:hypothetical protein
MAILDLSTKPAWYVVRIAAQRYGSDGYQGVSYRWSAPKYLNNLNALNYSMDVCPPTTSNGGITTYCETELWQWDGTRWTRAA